MSTFHLDLKNGNDSNDGSTWALAWKTITSGATAGRTAPGDTIKIAKSADPVSIGSCTFTNNSSSVTIPAGTILDICTCESAWTASANITCATDTLYYSQGSKSAKATPATEFTTGLAAYYATGELNLSSYQKIGFWVRTSGTTDSVWRLDLCSDVAGVTPVHSITIVHSSTAGQYITFDNGGALSSSIKSVALYALSDPGTAYIGIDNIIAFNSVGLGSVIGASSSGPWFPIMNISGTTVSLGYVVSGGSRRSCVYDGSTDTTTGYHRETIFQVPENTAIQESGTFGSLITYSGGWNTSTDSQDGETWIRCDTENAAIDANSKDFIHVKNISAAYSEEVLANPRYGCVLEDAFYSGCTDGFYVSSTYTHLELLGDLVGVGATSAYGISSTSENYNREIFGSADIEIHNVYTSSSVAVSLTGGIRLSGELSINCSLYGIYALRLAGGNVNVRRVVVTGSASLGGTYVYADGIYRIGELVTSGAGTEITDNPTSRGARLDIGYLDGDSRVSGTIYNPINIERYLADGRYYSARFGGTISDHITGGESAGWAYGGSGLSLYLDPRSTYTHLVHEFFMPVEASTEYHLEFQKIKTSSGADCTLRCQIAGAGITAIDESVILTDSWAKYTSTAFTPTRSGFVQVILVALDGNTTGNIGVDELALAV